MLKVWGFSLQDMQTHVSQIAYLCFYPKPPVFVNKILSFVYIPCKQTSQLCGNILVFIRKLLTIFAKFGFVISWSCKNVKCVASCSEKKRKSLDETKFAGIGEMEPINHTYSDGFPRLAFPFAKLCFSGISSRKKQCGMVWRICQSG